MSDTFRYRHGPVEHVMYPVDSATVIEIGDLVFLDTDDAKPASSQADQGSEALNQETFHDNFLGVAMDRSQSGDTDEIRVATAGVFEYPCDSATFEAGDMIGVAEAASGTELEDQKVTGTSTAPTSIGRCAKREGSAVTSVWVNIQSTILTGGVMTAE